MTQKRNQTYSDIFLYEMRLLILRNPALDNIHIATAVNNRLDMIPIHTWNLPWLFDQTHAFYNNELMKLSDWHQSYRVLERSNETNYIAC